MSKELIERLRNFDPVYRDDDVELMREAADELERLQGVEFGAQREAIRCGDLERENQRLEARLIMAEADRMLAQRTALTCAARGCDGCKVCRTARANS